MRQQHEMFCKKWIELDFNGEKAAIAAGYSPRSARQIAYRLLTRDDVKAYISGLLDRLTMDPNEVLRLYTEMARGERPTTVTTGSDGSVTESYGAKGALDSLARAMAMFIDRTEIDLRVDNLDIVDDENFTG